MTFIVTTSRNNPSEEFVLQLAEKFSWKYITRDKCDINKESSTNKVLVVEKHRLVLHYQSSELFFHPSLSFLRAKNIGSGSTDRLIAACNLKEGSTFLDCTLGLGSDSIVASCVVGDKGRVVALEAIPEIALITGQGLQNYHCDLSNVVSAMRRIKVINTDFRQYLTQCDSGIFDCIYFDPMFRQPKFASSGLNMLRPFAFNNSIQKEDISLALKKTRKYVVIKERSLSLLESMHPQKILGSKNANIFYGRWEI